MLVEDQIHKTKLPVKTVLERIKTKTHKGVGLEEGVNMVNICCTKFSKSNKVEKLAEKILG